MAATRIATTAAHFGRDMVAGLNRIEGIVRRARAEGADVLVLPHAALGGYLGDLAAPDPLGPPPALHRDDPVFARITVEVGPMVTVLGLTERRDDGEVSSAAVCLSGDGVLGWHRKVHLPPGEAALHLPGDGFAALDTPVGRVGMLIDYDKAFPESVRCLALDGATLITCPSAWPASVTRRASSLVNDRQTRLFDLYDVARAAENQVVLASANLTGTTGGLTFLGSAKVVDPGGAVLCRTGSKAGLVWADVDIAGSVAEARRVLDHLAERRVDAYAQCTVKPQTVDSASWRAGSDLS